MLIGVHSWQQDKLPDTDGEQGNQYDHAEDAEPSSTVSRGLAGETIVSNILCEAGPVGFLAICKSAGAVAGFEAFEPEGLVEFQGTEVTADEAFAEDAAGKLAEVSCLNVEQLPDGEFGRGAHGLERDATLLPLQTQLVPELNHAFRCQPPGEDLSTSLL